MASLNCRQLNRACFWLWELQSWLNSRCGILNWLAHVTRDKLRWSLLWRMKLRIVDVIYNRCAASSIRPTWCTRRVLEHLKLIVVGTIVGVIVVEIGWRRWISMRLVDLEGRWRRSQSKRGLLWYHLRTLKNKVEEREMREAGLFILRLYDIQS